MNTLHLGGQIYRNSLLDVPYTYEALTDILKSQKLKFSQLRSAEMFPAPSFTMTFYRFILKEDRIPTQAEFCVFFVEDEENKELIKNNMAKSRYKDLDKVVEGLKARAARTYPSLIRDLAFSIKVKEAGYETFWNPEVDVSCKADMVIKIDDQLYGIAMYTNTRRGTMCRSRKLGETEMPPELTKIELPINLSEGEKVGDFLLYGEKHINDLKALIA